LKQDRRQLLALSLGMTSISGLSVLLKPQKREANVVAFETMIPANFGDWEIDPSIIPIKPTPDAQANLDQIYDQLVTRTYKNSQSKQIMLTVAYGSQQTDKLKAHRQEVCYAAQGFRISELAKSSMDISNRVVPITRFMATQGYRKEPVSYWFTVGNAVVDSQFERLLSQVRYGFLGEIPDGLLVRISSLHNEPKLAYQDHDLFAAALISNLPSKDQQRFVGSIA
jgi:EpsI family protein